MNFNPYLKPWQAAQPNNVAGKGQIEVPGQVENIVCNTVPPRQAITRMRSATLWSGCLPTAPRASKK